MSETPKIELATPRIKFPAALAWTVAQVLCLELKPFCARLEVAGSLRRGRPQVGDVEILYVGRWEEGQLPGSLLTGQVDTAECAIEELLLKATLEQRRTARGTFTWGPQIKLARHKESGIPVDFFKSSAEGWWNYLVCRTGPAESNLAIAKAARARGWKWEPYSSGFCRADNPKDRHAVTSEHEVFEFVGLPYLEAKDR